MISPIDDTITAQASARGAAYRGILRVSGPDAVAVMQPWFRFPVANGDDNHSLNGVFRPLDAEKRPCIVRGELTVWGDELPVPCQLYFWPEGRGFTGQQAIELHTIGSQPLLDTILQRLCESGCRLAGPGEFTLRAFLAGRIDLTQAEAVLGVIDADDCSQLEVALRQLAGGVGRPLVALRERLFEMICHLEAEFDFADEDIEFLDRNLLLQELESSLRLIEQILQQMQQRVSTSERPRVVLIGRPNTGKSSLFNALVDLAATHCAHPAFSAIVSPQPGTTRDWLEAELQIGELRFLLLDTAGIETVENMTDDQPRRLAQTITRDAVEHAALVLLCLETGEQLTESERIFLHENTGRTLVILTKSDLASVDAIREIAVMATSAKTGEGLPQLLDAIQARCIDENVHGEFVPATALRCRESLSRAAESLRNALLLTETFGDDLLIATEIRVALEHIGQMTGAVYNDEILDRIFSRFCIGK
ncbi:MAG: tRNA modification GTPase [Planctomycetaceae bacterium]|nr:tRNA modification GTPase [Planctomycetaceae bacterium]